LCLILGAALSAGALDFGLALNQELKISDEIGDSVFFYTPIVSPWASGPLGERFSLYLSGKLGLEYVNSFGDISEWRDPPVLPELDRSELTWFVSPALSVTLGRQRFEDPSGLAASGLFDGLGASFSAGGSRFSAGAWYTGLLYKGTAKIIMTNRDREGLGKPLSLDESYFASRRILLSFGWENPSLDPRSSLALGARGQFDVNGEDDWFHSQYLSARYGLRLSVRIGLDAAAVFGLGEARDEARVFFAGSLGMNWTLPGGPEDRLSLRGLYSSPTQGEGLLAFAPLNSLPQGQVFSPALGGLALIKAAYTVQPMTSLSLGAESSYFIRTDTVSFQDNREPDKLKGEGALLGAEFYGTARWAPLPDLALILGGGAFFPGLGNAFDGETAIRWKLAVGLILSF
jgi:hypothetical protein